MKTILIVDTNVLLNDPHALFVYPEAELVVPQVVLAELDKIKMARNDREIKFRGREISRILFGLSEHGPLLEGVQLDNDAAIRVAQFESEGFPETLNPKNADDRILGCAWQTKKQHPEARVILLTNDLNMLLKAQTLGIEVQRHEKQFEPTYFSQLFGKLGRKRLSLGWLAVPILMIGVLIGLWLFEVPSPIPGSPASNVFNAPSYPLKEVQYLESLKKDPSSSHVWFQLGQLYSDWAEQLQANSEFTEARGKFTAAIDAYQQTLGREPNNVPARTNLGTAYFFLGNYNEAVSQFVQAINIDSTYSLAHFNLGFVLHNNFRDPNGAARHFEAYLKLEPNGERSDYARQVLQKIKSPAGG